MSKALVCYADGSEDMEVTAITDILNRGGVEVTICAIKESNKVHLAHGTVVECKTSIDKCTGGFDVIAIPGGLKGAENCRDNKTLIDLLKKQKEAGKFIAAICAAPGFVLAHHGLIGSARATGYPGCSDNIENYSQKGAVLNLKEKIITGQGPAYAMDFAFAILQALKGSTIVDKVKQGMLFERECSLEIVE